MNDLRRRSRVGIALILTCLLVLLAAAAQAAPWVYDLSWWTADNGGGYSQTGSYGLSGTTAQPDAGTLLGGSYTLAGGFWSAAPSAPIVIEYQIALPLLQK